MTKTEVENLLLSQPAPEPQTFMGVPLEEFSREALIRIVAMTHEMEQHTRSRTRHMMKTLSGV
jgi:hypothetical protein